MIDRCAHGAAAVPPSCEVRGQPPDGRFAVVARELARPLDGDVTGSSELVAGVDELERVLDRGRREQASGELCGDAGAAEALALLEGADEVLRECEIVDETRSFETLDLVPRSHRRRALCATQSALDLALRHARAWSAS